MQILSHVKNKNYTVFFQIYFTVHFGKLVTEEASEGDISSKSKSRCLLFNLIRLLPSLLLTADKMRFIVLITIIVTVALIDGGSSMTAGPSSPCQDKSPKSHYEEFVSRHILQEEFDRNSIDAWKR